MNSLFTLFFLLSLSLNAAVVKSIGQRLSSFKCQKEISNLNLQWLATKEWRGHPTALGDIQLKRPTQKFAHWMVLEKNQDTETISLINPLQVIKVELNKNCQSKMGVYPHKHYSNPNGFNDLKLMNAMTKEKKGIVLLWSPGMDHSYTAISRLSKLSRELKIPIHYVLDPFADEKLALSGLKTKKLVLPTIEKNSSLELFYRDASMHYPSFLIYKDGQFISHLIPGLMSEIDYKKTLTRYLGVK